MMLRRWRLYASPCLSEDPSMNDVATRLADYWNEKPVTYFTRRSARNAAHFFTEVLGLPVLYEPVRCEDVNATATGSGTDADRG